MFHKTNIKSVTLSEEPPGPAHSTDGMIIILKVFTLFLDDKMLILYAPSPI